MTGVVAAALTLPAAALASEPATYQQAPPANAQEWDDAVTAIQAGVEPAEVIDWRLLAIRDHVAWVNEIWACVFGRTVFDGEHAPFVPGFGPVDVGVHTLESASGELATLRVAKATRVENQDLVSDGQPVFPVEVVSASLAYVAVANGDCERTFVAVVLEIASGEIGHSLVVPAVPLTDRVFSALWLSANGVFLPGYEQQPAVGEIDPAPIVCEETLCAQLARDRLNAVLAGAGDAIDDCEAERLLDLVIAGASCAVGSTTPLGWLGIAFIACAGLLVDAFDDFNDCLDAVEASIDNAWDQYRLDLVQCGFDPPASDSEMYGRCYSEQELN